jgi:hypothetical protein
MTLKTLKLKIKRRENKAVQDKSATTLATVNIVMPKHVVMETGVAFKKVITSMFLINLYQADEFDEKTNYSAPSLSRHNTL